MELQILTPRWALPLIPPCRYKGAKGGRGCVHPDTLINTPDGDIKISEFKGGNVYTMINGVVGITFATQPKQYDEQDLYEVVTSKGLSIVCTDEHKFLTSSGWRMLKDISISDEVFCEPDQGLSFLHQTSSGSDPLALPLNDQHCFETHVGFQGRYSLYHHQYDQQPQSLEDTYQASSPSLADEPQHSYHASCRSGDQWLYGKDNLSLAFLHASNPAFPQGEAGRSCVSLGSHAYGKTSVQPSGIYQEDQISHSCKSHTYKDSKSIALGCDPYIVKGQSESHRTGLHTQCFSFDGSSYINTHFESGKPIVHDIVSIRKHSHLKYWDLHVPETNCYFANGILNHNSGKSHFFAELLIEEMIADPNLQAVCIREIQKSLKFSAKKLLEDKIRSLGVSHLFDCTLTEIRRIGGDGICIFQGMQDHTADSVKSLEGFDRCWVEEAQSLSSRSMELLLPTIRAPGSQIWFGWNPENDYDPVDVHFSNGDPDCVCVHVNFNDNPFCPPELISEAKRHLKNNPDTYEHVWLGGYNKKSDAQIFNGKYTSYEFEPQEDWEPMYGLDWGFANDPTTAVEVYVDDNVLYIRRECGKVGLELDHTGAFIANHIPNIEKHVVRADCARPESISHVKKRDISGKRVQIPKMEPCKKWAGSVEDGIEHMRSYEQIVIHPDCIGTLNEFRKYSYKIHKQSGDILPIIVDDFNHYIDAIRYALGNLIKAPKAFFVG